MPTAHAATTAPSAGTAAHEHDAHIRAQRAAWYVALRRGLDARGSLPPVEPWADDVDAISRVQPGARQIGLPEWWYSGDDRWKQLEGSRIPPAPTTGSQWCGVLRPGAPRECVVREVVHAEVADDDEWDFVRDGQRLRAVAYGMRRSASPATPASIPHTRDDGRVEWRDDPDLLDLPDARFAMGLARARLLGGTAAGDPPSPWWEGDGRGRA